MNAEDWDQQGCELCQQEQYAAAIAAFDRAIEFDPLFSKAWNSRGNALSAMKRFAEALGSYDRAVMLQSDYHQAWFNRGLLLAEMMAYGMQWSPTIGRSRFMLTRVICTREKRFG